MVVSAVSWFWGAFFLLLGTLPGLIYIILVFIGRWKNKQDKQNLQLRKLLLTHSSPSTLTLSSSASDPSIKIMPNNEGSSFMERFPSFDLKEGNKMIMIHHV